MPLNSASFPWQHLQQRCTIAQCSEAPQIHRRRPSESPERKSMESKNQDRRSQARPKEPSSKGGRNTSKDAHPRVWLDARRVGHNGLWTGTCILYHRIAQRRSRQQLARMVDSTEQAIADIEDNVSRPSSSMWQRIIVALQL